MKTVKAPALPRVRAVPLVDLISSPVQSELRNRGIPRMVENLRRHGQQCPVIVTTHRAPPGKYIVIDGHHRVAAAQVLGWSAVPCVINGTDCEIGYGITNGDTQRFTDRHGFESWARASDSDQYLSAYTRKQFVYDVKLFAAIVGKRRAKEIAVAGIASPSWARHARTIYNMFQVRTVGDLARQPGSRLSARAGTITEKQILEWIIRQRGSNACANVKKAIDLQKHLNRFAYRILKDRPFPVRDWL
jgi:hypothetical protein